MTLEELIYKRISESAAAERLALHNGAPAVFFGPVPTDTDPGWAGAEQYPRISYTIDMRANPERQTAGNLYLDVWCLDSGTAPEAVEPSVRAALCDVIVAPHEQPPYSLAWVTSETFEATKQLDKSARIIGVTVTFDLYALPQQETTDPDPIMAMNAFTNRWSDAVTVIGSDRMGEYTEPSDERPAAYFRLANYHLAQETHTVAWMEGVLVGHMIAPTYAGRQRWLKALADELATRGEVEMLDTSPMFIRALEVDGSLDPLTAGQMRLGVPLGNPETAEVRPQAEPHQHELQLQPVKGGYYGRNQNHGCRARRGGGHLYRGRAYRGSPGKVWRFAGRCHRCPAHGLQEDCHR